MNPQDRPEAHQIVWDAPSLEHSTWHGPPAFDFSQEEPVKGLVAEQERPAETSAQPHVATEGQDPYEPQPEGIAQPANPPQPRVVGAPTDEVSEPAPAAESAPDLPFAPAPVPESYADAPAQGRSGISTESSAAPQSDNGSSQPERAEDHPEVSEDSLTIGRSRSNGIVLDDMLVSRRHVVITADDEGLLLRDLDSRNGTFVNGRKVEQTHLHEGDRIGIGASTFEVRDGWLVAV